MSRVNPCSRFVSVCLFLIYIFTFCMMLGLAEIGLAEESEIYVAEKYNDNEIIAPSAQIKFP